MDYFRIDQVCDVNPPKDISRFKGMEVSFIPMDAVSTTGEVDVSRTISGDGVKNYSVFQNRDVLFAKITPCMENGKGGIVDDLMNGFGAGSTEFIVIRPDEMKVISEWILLFLAQSSYRLECKNHMTGSAGQKRVPPKFIAGTVIPVPSVDEQRRIVSRIEEMFSELDNNVSTLQKTKEQLAVYRQAVLKDAFKGNYNYEPLSTISKAIGGYAFKSKMYSDSGKYIVVKIGNVKSQGFDFTRDLTKTTECDKSILEKYLLKKGDCVISLTGSRGKRDYGFVCIISDESNYLVNQRVAALRFNTKRALPEFYYYYLASPLYRDDFFKYETGNVGQGNVGIKALIEPMVPVPSMNEQEELVTEIESRLSVCDSIEQTVDTALQQAEAMRQSILKQVFEGRL